MKTLRNLFLVLALTTSYAMADGHTGSGNRCDTCEPCTENCIDGGGQLGSTSGELTLTEGETEDSTAVENWSDWFFDLIGYGQF